MRGRLSAAIFVFVLFASCRNPFFQFQSDDDDTEKTDLPSYAVTFNGNGNTGGTAPTAMTANAGASITLPAKGTLARDDYAFDGWNTKADGTGTNYSAHSAYTVTANITLYAKWNINHQWGGWTVTANATETTDGVETRTCSVCGETETRFSGEYATGTFGLDFQLINNDTAYGVRKGSVTDGAVHIPAYHRPDADSPYMPVTSIEVAAFNNLSNNLSITSITIPNSVMSIGSYAFEFCTSLASVTIGEGVTSIDEYAFSACTSLTGITIPNSVTLIGDSAFDYCTSLTSVTFAGTIASGSFGSDAFDGDLVTVYLDAGGGAGTYTRSGSGASGDPYVWTKQ